MMYFWRKFWLKKNIRICNGIEADLRHDLRLNEEARRRYEEMLLELETEERHRVINGILERAK